MKTKLTAAIMLLGALQSGVVSGLGLGDIDVASSLNERLEAEIPLVNARGLDPSQILIKLASSADFARADVEKPYFLNSLKFTIARGKSGKPVLNVTTPEVLREPYLNFLIEVRWPNGRMLREYMVLLDLPIYSADSGIRSEPSTSFNESRQVAVTQPSAGAQPNSGTSFTPLSLPSRDNKPGVVNKPARRSNPVRSDASVSVESYQVKRNDSLWKIAKAVKPGGVNLNQAMLAIQKANPHAFIDNNINLLKRGAVLRIPAASDIDDVSTVAANSSLAQQEKLWRNRVRKPEADLRPLQDARANDATQRIAANTPDGRLTLSSTGRSAADLLPQAQAKPQELSSSRSNTNDPSVDEILSLQKELASSLENLDRASLENQSLAERIDEVETQFNDLERLLELKNKELESVRLSLEERASTLSGSSSTNTQTSAPTAEKGVLEQIAAALSISVTALLGGLAGLVTILVGLFVWLSSRGRDDYNSTVFEAPDVEEQRPSFTNEPAASATHASEQVRSAPVESANDTVIEDAVPEESNEPVSEHREAVTEAPDDPLAEADIYLAYGRHQQAVNMLANAIEAEPMRTDLRMKLLEVFNDAGDLSQIEAQKGQILTLDESLEPEINALLGIETTSAVESDASVAAEDLDLDLDTNFDPKLEDTGAIEEPPAEASNAVLGEELEEEVATKLDLARAYMDMGDYDGAKEILAEVLDEGSSDQQSMARDMLEKCS